MRALRISARAAFLVTMAVMLLPWRWVFDIDLGDLRLQGAFFGITMLLWVIVRGREPSEGLRDCYGSHNWSAADAIAALSRNIAVAGLELSAFAAAAEIAQAFEPARHSALGDFLSNALTVVAVGTACYVAGLYFVKSGRG